MNFSYLLLVLAAVVHSSAALKAALSQQALTHGDSKLGGCPSGMTDDGHYTIPSWRQNINKNEFRHCTSLKSITIPNTVKRIKDRAFMGCTGLTSVTMPDSLWWMGIQVFQDCSSLTSITIPDGVKSIGRRSFLKCYNLTSVTIPDGVTSIGSQAFEKCYGLKSGGVIIPDGVTSIESRAFFQSLTSVAIPDSVTSIEVLAFAYSNPPLDIVKFGDNSHLKHIGTSAFAGSAITEVDFGDMIMHIGAHAFSGSELTEVEIPVGCYLGHNAFPSDVSVTYGYNSMLGSVDTSGGLIQIGNANLARAGATCDNDDSQCGRFKEMKTGWADGGVQNTDVDEDPFLRDCRVLAEIAEKSGSLWKCMQAVDGNFADNDCKTTIDNEIQNRINATPSVMNETDAYAIYNRDACFECFADGTGASCPPAMQGCKSTRKYFDFDSAGQKIKVYYNGPDCNGNPDCVGDAYEGTQFTIGDRRSDRLYGCFGLTGHGLDPAMHPSSGLLEQRAGEGGRSNASSFMRTTAGKA